MGKFSKTDYPILQVYRVGQMYMTVHRVCVLSGMSIAWQNLLCFESNDANEHEIF